MIVSAVRWAVVDTLHHWTGLPMPPLDFSKLGQNVEAFALLIEIHYKHYLFYANMTAALGIAYTCYRVKLGALTFGWPDVGFAMLETILLVTSRSTLARYYVRSQQLLAQPSD